MKILTDNSLTVLWNRLKKGVLNNRKYEPTEFSGKGYKVLEKNIQTISGVKKNILTTVMINQPNTIYEIRYDFDLDGKTIIIPNNCILYFTSGKFYNGSINMDNTIISTLYENVLSDVNISGNYYNIQEHIKNYQRQLDDKQSQIDDKQQQITANDEDISLLQTRSTQMEETIKGIAASGGASQASAVTYENTESGLNSINAQEAIDELANKKLNKENIAQEFGDSKDKVVSQFAIPFREIDSLEFLKAIVDSDDKVLSATYNDGSHYIHNVMSETIPTEFDHIEDKEGRLEITVDANGKVLADRKRDGERYETKMNIESLKVSNLNLEGNSSYDIAKALKEINYKGFDWSDWVKKNSTPLELAIPRKAIVNITGVKNLPSKKAVNDKAYLEYYDLSGNYFKVKAYLNAQGASTLEDPMKSCAIDLFSNDWGGESYEVKFGNWIAQDSFHLKAFYKDALKSIQPISYDIGNQILSYLNVRANRFHIMKTDDILSGARGDTKYDFSQALCMPSQFPVEVYLNGDYYGLFMWSLKKNRDNYSMDKKDYTSILIDNVGSIYHYNGDIGCSWDELKNPKTLICVDGKKYDADTHMGEIIGTDTVAGKKYTFKKLNASTTDFDYFTVTSVDYNPLNEDMKNTAKTKAIINECSKYVKYIHDTATDEEKKKLALKYFDVPNIIAYIIFTELTFNQDGRINNAQITIYDGKVGYNIYDCDSCLGKTWSGVFWSASIVSEVIPANKDNWMPTDVIKSLFSEEINDCYKKLRDSGVISTENINKIIDSWFDRIGKETLERSIKKWSSPSYRKVTNVNVNWEFYICKSLENEVVSQCDESVEYHVGDKVYLKNKTGWDSYYYKCIKDCTGIYPTKNNSLEPNAVYDSFSRIKEWIKYKIEFCDKLFLYNQ